MLRSVLAEDLELGTGAVEGAIKNIIGERWIKERVEAIVQLRCIEATGDFEAFTDFVRRRLFAQPDDAAAALIVRPQATTPANLPTRGLAA